MELVFQAGTNIQTVPRLVGRHSCCSMWLGWVVVGARYTWHPQCCCTCAVLVSVQSSSFLRKMAAPLAYCCWCGLPFPILLLVCEDLYQRLWLQQWADHVHGCSTCASELSCKLAQCYLGTSLHMPRSSLCPCCQVDQSLIVASRLHGSCDF